MIDDYKFTKIADFVQFCLPCRSRPRIRPSTQVSAVIWIKSGTNQERRKRFFLSPLFHHFLPFHTSFSSISFIIFFHSIDHFLPFHSSFSSIPFIIFFHSIHHFLPFHTSFSSIPYIIFFHFIDHFLPFHSSFSSIPYIIFFHLLFFKKKIPLFHLSVFYFLRRHFNHYSAGSFSRWHPYIPPFGFTRCAVCTCIVSDCFLNARAHDVEKRCWFDFSSFLIIFSPEAIQWTALG